ncbi:MAG: hypothetical protein H0X01_00900 [Nitrospira sp.]|nr:hypothetical protein [Nitrospira sp.]
MNIAIGLMIIWRSMAEYGGRHDRIHLADHSSGAHMAVLLTVDTQYLAAEGKAKMREW